MTSTLNNQKMVEMQTNEILSPCDFDAFLNMKLFAITLGKIFELSFTYKTTQENSELIPRLKTRQRSLPSLK